MPVFNPGDRVRRVSFSHPNRDHDPRNFGQIDGVYTVLSCSNITLRLQEITGLCAPANFELVVAAATDVVPEASPAKAFFWLFVYKDSDGRVQKRARLSARDSNAMKTALQYRLAEGNISHLHMKKIAINLPGGYDADV